MDLRTVLRWLGGPLLPEADREVVLGDLDELYAHNRRTRGRWRAEWTYARHLAASVVRRRLAPHPPTGAVGASTGPVEGLDTLRLDVRLAFRSLRRNPAFALGSWAVLTVALAGVVAIVSLFDSVLLRPLAFPDPDRIVAIETTFTHTGVTSPRVSGADFLDWQDRAGVFESMAAVYRADDFSAVVGDQALFVDPRYVTVGFFDVFGQVAAAGRLLADRDVPARDEEAGVAVLAHAWAVQHFGSAPAAVGATVVLYGTPLEVVGVASPDFRHPDGGELWVPMAVEDHDRGLYDYEAVGKLAAGIELDQARARMEAVGHALAELHADNRLKGVTLVPLQDRLTGGVRPTLWILVGAVGLLWLIACANLGTLFLARADDRAAEVALRAALGAGRRRAVRQLWVESGVLAGAAGMAGLGLAWFFVAGVVRLSPADLPRVHEVAVGWVGVAAGGGLTLLSALILGALSLRRVGRLELSEVLKRSSSRAAGSAARTSLRSGLVVAEVALSVVLLATAGLLTRSLQALRTEDLGFTTDRVVVAYMDYAVASADDIPVRTAFYAGVLDRLRSTPGVEAAAGVAYLGMGREPREPRDYFVDGRPEGVPGARPQAELHAVTEQYFETLGIPLLAGRDFGRDDTAEVPRVAIVNEALARAAFPDGPAVGQRVRTGTGAAPWMEIVGVVGDTRWQDPARPAPPVIYAASNQGAGNALSILARTAGHDDAVVARLRDLVHEADPDVPVEFDTLDGLFDATLAHPRFRARVLGLFAAVATVLAALGIFSVLAYLVGQRTRELAVRRALGARPPDVVRQVVGDGLRIVGVGLAVGLAAAAVVGRAVAGVLYQVGPWDPATFAGTAVLLGGAALLAVVLPAVRAASIAPAIALRE